jgi:hypothetical protein
LVLQKNIHRHLRPKIFGDMNRQPFLKFFPFGETETRHHSHDIIRRYFPAGDLKILITIFQASNYGLLTDRLNATGLLIEKAMINVAEWFMNANSLDGE